MRTGSPQDREKYKELIYYMDWVLYKLPVHQDPVFRGIDCQVEGYEPGKTITWNAYSSSTTDPQVAIKFLHGMDNAPPTGTLFLIESKNSRLISKFSAIPSENEALFPANCTFLVIQESHATKKTS